jgi:hypothetical protein
MAIVRITGLRSALSRMQWRRGLRAALAVGVAMLACYLLHKPIGWAALGAFQVIVVDNGGPYRSRLANILTILIGGSRGPPVGRQENKFATNGSAQPKASARNEVAAPSVVGT